ncbi:hypothetical protein ILUMI_16111 [Ignelater luminosus]|uniref:Uncharacterized protein n=1 Tax=Ignelater luminosus TaxID=2038154 RepID=A0A8K0CTI9_IGNLU|nr:hypothetical protein ILUMI_16111 [Ignelater luminosus]
MMQFINIEKDVSEFVSNLEAVFGFGQMLGLLAGLTHLPLLENSLPLGTWTLQNYQEFYYYVMVEEMIMVPLGSIFLATVDCMYLGFCAEIVIQFRILSHCLEELVPNVKSLYLLFSHTFQAQVRHTLAFAILSCRLCFYCTAANYVAIEALAVSDAVYSSKWYSYRFSRLKATLLLMIQNSQNGITIKAGGLVTINADTIVKVLRVAWSACSILRGLRQN